MKKEFRLKKKSDIDAVFKPRKAVKSEFFSIYFIEEQQDHFRYALSIGKKYGHAVDRNLMKRRIRMIVQQNQEMIKKSMQFVIVIHPKSSTLSFNVINEQIVHLLKKSKIMEIK
jgi:ribonuclease P protein component